MTEEKGKAGAATDGVDLSIKNPDVVTKYRTAADIANRSLVKVIAACKAGTRIIDICLLGDKAIEEECKNVFKAGKVVKGVGFPTCISVNHIICHMSPLPSDPESEYLLKADDLVKIELGSQIDGYTALLAHSLVIGASKENPVTGRKADVLMAAYQAAEAALRLIKPGHKNMEVTETIQKIAQSYGCIPVEGMVSHQQERNVLDGKKQIILNPTETQRKDFDRAEFMEGEVYSVDILVSTGEGKPKDAAARTTVFKKTDTTYLLKMKASRSVFNEVTSKFGQMPFTLRAMEDEKAARMGIVECAKHSLVTPYPIFTEKEGEFVAQFLFTVLLMPGGQTKITNTPFNLEIIKTDKSIQDEAIKAILGTAVQTKKKSKSKRKKAAPAGKAEAEEGEE